MDPLELAVVEQRSIEQACAELRAKYQRHPTASLARIVERLEAEIACRRKTAPLKYRMPEPESVA
jgi:hypothetical protein